MQWIEVSPMSRNTTARQFCCWSLLVALTIRDAVQNWWKCTPCGSATVLCIFMPNITRKTPVASHTAGLETVCVGA